MQYLQNYSNSKFYEIALQMQNYTMLLKKDENKLYFLIWTSLLFRHADDFVFC
jgi:hypothetical protein